MRRKGHSLAQGVNNKMMILIVTCNAFILQADLDGDRFLEDLKHSVSRSQAFDAILRVRTSTGILNAYFYNFNFHIWFLFQIMK